MGRAASATIGLDVGGTKILGLLVDPDGAVVQEHRVPTPRGPHALVDALAGCVELLTLDGAAAPAAIGVGIAGLVGTDGVLRYSPNIPEVIDLDLRGLLAARTGLPVVVDNDATAATVAEHRLGAAAGVRDAVYVALGTGIGGGIVLDGAVRRGAHGFAGEFGHMVIDPGGPLCACGRQGCWETTASGSALGDLARARVDAGAAPAILALAGGDPTAVTGESAVAAAEGGDDAANAVLAAFGDAVGQGISVLVTALDPEVVVVGGGVVEAGDLVMDPIRAAVVRTVMGRTHRPPVEIVPAAFGAGSAAIGAALLAAEHA